MKIGDKVVVPSEGHWRAKVVGIMDDGNLLELEDNWCSVGVYNACDVKPDMEEEITANLTQLAEAYETSLDAGSRQLDRLEKLIKAASREWFEVSESMGIPHHHAIFTLKEVTQCQDPVKL